MTPRMLTEPLTVQCPHCGQWNDKVHSDQAESTAALRANPDITIVLVCIMCGGPFFLDRGLPRVIEPDEWLELPAEWRGTIQRACQDVNTIRQRLEARLQARRRA